MGERGCMHDSANKDTNGMVMVMKERIGRGTGTTTKTRTSFPCHTRERKPVKNTDNTPSCLEQLFNNLVIRNLRDICPTIVHPPQHVDLQQTSLMSRDEKLQGHW